MVPLLSRVDFSLLKMPHSNVPFSAKLLYNEVSGPASTNSLHRLECFVYCTDMFRGTNIYHLRIGEYTRESRELLHRIGLEPQQPSLAYLEEVVRKYSRLPYENISKILKLAREDHAAPFRMPDEIRADFDRARLGGTCFSLTYYLLEILTFCGFNCAPVMGDMKWGENVHCAILVDYQDQRYLVDPGYMVHQPLRISKDTRQRHFTPHSGIEIRFDPSVERYDLYTFRSGNFTWRYRFSDRPVSMDEFSRHWAESFYKPTMHGICLTRVQENSMIYVHNDYTKITGHSGSQKQTSRDVAEKVIRHRFGISLELVEEARAALEVNREKENRILHSDSD